MDGPDLHRELLKILPQSGRATAQFFLGRFHGVMFAFIKPAEIDRDLQLGGIQQVKCTLVSAQRDSSLNGRGVVERLAFGG